jgi:hypothetical protein
MIETMFITVDFETIFDVEFVGMCTHVYNLSLCHISLNYWGMHPVARVSIKYQNTSVRDKYLVRVLLCTLYTTCFGPDQCPSSGDSQHIIYLKVVTNISTDPLSQIYKRGKTVVTVSLKQVVV